MPHIGLGTVQQPLELQSICVPVRNHIAHLTDYCGENKNANQVAYDGENVPARKTAGRVNNYTSDTD